MTGQSHPRPQGRRPVVPDIWGFILYLLIISGLMGCSFQMPPPPREIAFPISLRATPWPEADSLFHTDPRWRGADDAYSVDLGHGRVMWLFGDSLITTGAGKDRAAAKLIRNSIAIQQGYDPSRASLEFFWKTLDREPVAFFPQADDTWLWPGDGEALGQRLILFFMEIGPADNALGFELTGWRALMIDNPEARPPNWRMRWLKTPANDFKAVVGSGSVFVQGEHLFALAYQENTRDILLARWQLADAHQGHLAPIEWWCGPDQKWVLQKDLKTAPTALFSKGQAELTLHFEPHLGSWLVFQTQGFGPAHVATRQSKQLTMGWSPLTPVFAPPEQDIDEVMIYAAKAHPHLTGADRVVTYCTNSFNYQAVLEDERLYYPRFLKMSLRKD